MNADSNLQVWPKENNKHRAMSSVILVEPNDLVRVGILQTVQNSFSGVSCEEIGYTQLFSAPAGDAAHDLMLLATPDDFDQTAELLKVAQRNYAPKRILLLSEIATPSYSLHALPTALAGYLPKHSAAAILTAAISLILAGGQCFPPQIVVDERRKPDDQASNRRHDAHPRRRWYDKPPHPPDIARPVNESASLQPGLKQPEPAAPTAFAEAIAPKTQAAGQAARECKLLGLTRRQYEVLVLLARGYSIDSISRELNVSASTVKTHADSLYQRLSVHSRHAAVFEAISRGATLNLNNAAAVQTGFPPC